MSDRKKLTKPTGITGPITVTFGATGSVAEFKQLEFPKTKEEIEKFIVNGFLKAAATLNFLPQAVVSASQNDQANFDFSLKLTGGGTKSLELMEIAPLENLRGSYVSAPASYKPYDFARFIFEKLMAKSQRYKASNQGGLILLVYVTDWHFVLSQTVTALLQYWTCHTAHSFEAIYCYSPMDESSGIAELIYPTQTEFWTTFDPERYKENLVINLSPTAWVSG